MTRTSSPLLRRLAAAALSGLLLRLVFPSPDLSWLAWVALVPVWASLRRATSWSSVAGQGMVMGLLFFGTAWYWISRVTPGGTVLLVIVCSIIMTGWAVGVWWCGHQAPPHAPRWLMPLIGAGLWAIHEWVRGHLWTGFNWTTLGNSQWRTLPLLQHARWAGELGVGWLIVFVNGCVVEACLTRSLRRRLVWFALAVCTLGTLWGVGWMWARRPVEGPTWTMAIAQGNIPQERKWDETRVPWIIQIYEGLTRVAATATPDIIIWPETAVPGYIDDDPPLRARLSKLAGEAGVPLLVGTPMAYRAAPAAQPHDEFEDLAFNSAVLIRPDGEIGGRYDKVHLVPFGEYVPFQRWLGWIAHRIELDPFNPGEDFQLINVARWEAGRIVSPTPVVKMATLICYEDAFSDIAYAFRQRGADVLVNITNDGWFGHTAGPIQHAQASVLRAVETGCWVIRAANTGVSGVIDPRGRWKHMLTSEDGDPLEVRGVEVWKVGIQPESTPFLLYGELKVMLAILLLTLLCASQLRQPSH